MYKKVVFITYHNWKTKRHGGFHQFAEYSCSKGIETVFFSFSRPYYIIFKNEERLNRKVLFMLTRGIYYELKCNKLLNVTWPTLALPGFLRRFFPASMNEWLMKHSFMPFKQFANKWLYNSDCFVFESCDAVFLLPLVKKYFPKAKIVYRPSDPLVEFANEDYYITAEKEMITMADKVLVVNIESLNVYREAFSDIFVKEKFHVVSNGVSLEAYLKKYEKPSLMKTNKNALYVGSFSPDWNLIFKAATELMDVIFIIITPNKPQNHILKIIDKYQNIQFIPGIPPEDVPKWVTNANLIIQPFSMEMQHFNKKSLGLTAQNYKAMAARKPIVAYGIPMHLSVYGLVTTNTYDGFIAAVRNNIDRKNVEYKIDLESKEWNTICDTFLYLIQQ